ncbi:MAG: FtsW/RodA/SpoVE family cell cycle protein [Bacteroidales bacterium]|nr:FtsW/RodA/SpoVE family cell cycle protein [Candidatus Cryptobacteroides equifaecalis]
MAESKKKKTLWNFVEHLEGDKVVWIIVLMLILVSIVCMFSSTSRLLKEGETRIDLVKSQFTTVFMGLGLILVCYNIKSVNFFRNLSKYGFLASLVLLVLLVSKIDTGFIKSISLNGARRILSIKGQQLHVFEAVKIMMVMYLSWAVDALKKGELKGPKEVIWQKILYIYGPFLITTALILPGSNSSAIFIGGIMFMVILLGGGNLKELSILAASVLILAIGSYGIYKLSDGKYMQRVGTFMNRVSDKDWEEIYLNSTDRKERQTALDKIRQPVSAKIAIKEGGLIGKGPGQSTQRYVVPDISEDYMYSFIIEEYGFVGGLLVLILYVSLMARGALIARNCGNDLYAALCVAGLTLLISGQAFLHMCVNTEIGPMTGQTLPLISHGNFAFLCFCGAFGVILSFSRIAARRIEKETLMAEPLMEMHEDVGARLQDLEELEEYDI